jgi:transposase
VKLTGTAAPTLRVLLGVGPDSAAALLIAAGDNWQRLHSEAAFAAEGKTRKEIIRCLKRYVAREVFAALHQTDGKLTTAA